MINLSQEMCQEMGLTYWQLDAVNDKAHSEIVNISREEKELLRKILMVKGITLVDENISIKKNRVVEVTLNQYHLIFDDVNMTDSANKIYLSKLADMLVSTEQKKLTWIKLKNKELN
jgi:hypothetical protein